MAELNKKSHFLTDIDFSKKDVKNFLNSLDISKSPGPNNFHPRILNKLSNELSELYFYSF